MRIERTEWDGCDAAAQAQALRATVPAPEEVAATVTEILAEVADRGDDALRELSARLDGVESVPDSLRVTSEDLARASEEIPDDLREAMELAAANIRAVAEAELAASLPVEVVLAGGQRVEVTESPVRAAGVYAPGGRAAYPSSVLMCCVPARAAGVERIALASPPDRDGKVNPAVLAACAVAGVEEVHAIGGAQAVGALALGTNSIAAVDVVAGPGNRYVVEAKRRVSARVGIDGIAGPSELVVVADGSADPAWIALDVCAQAEHGPDGLLVVISADDGLLDRVASGVGELASEWPRVSDATAALVGAPDLDAALGLADALAPEHLELQLDGVTEATARGRVAGCVFVGSSAGTAFGDYAAGSNHVLPTGGSARFGGPLGPRTFMRRSSVVSIPPGAVSALAPAVGALARAEGFPLHGKSAEARAGDNGRGAKT